MPQREYRRRLYGSYFKSSGYGRLNPADAASYAHNGRVLRQVLGPYLPADRGGAILDVACGSGYAVKMLLDAGYRNTEGIDLSPDQVAVARDHALPVNQANAFDFLSGVADRYTGILALDFIEHLDRDELLTFLDLVRDALVPGGRLIVKTPNASSPMAARFRYVDLTHEQLFTEKSLRSAFALTGLDEIAVAGEQIRPFTLRGWIRWIPSRLVRLAWKSFLIAELGEEGFGIPTEFNLLGVAEKRGMA